MSNMLQNFLRIDVAYLPKVNGVKHYLYVVIDGATRTMYYKIYSSKTALNTKDFILEVADFLPFNITHILTDNVLLQRSPHAHLRFQLL